jgi:GTP-binding protein
VPDAPPPATDLDRFDDPETIEEGRLLFARPCRFLLGVARLDQLPPAGLPEVAFAGRSNVGKSSLINALLGRRDLARTSNTPGRTQEVNLFNLGERLVLADLPGYGYAKAPLEKVKGWTDLVFAYLRGRPNLARACLLIDARRGIMPVDEEAMTLLGRAAVPFAVVLTKADLLKAAEREALEAGIRKRLERQAAALPYLFATSSRERQGLDLLRASLARLAAPAPDRSPQP